MDSSKATPVESMPTSPYERLRSPNIRLVSFQSTKDDSIAIDLLDVPLTEDLEYQALSYVWEHGPAAKTIWVNDHAFPVSRHLYNFLEMARRHDVVCTRTPSAEPNGDDLKGPGDANFGAQSDNDGVGLLKIPKGGQSQMKWWIDAICIDQSSIDESNEQVPRMGEIYTSAARVWIWFGQPCDVFGDNLAFEWFKQALAWTSSSLSAQRPSLARLVDDEQVAAVAASDDISAHQESMDVHAYYGLELLVAQVIKLLKNKYFTRTWVLQEMFLSRYEPTAVIGTLTFSLHHIFNLCTNLNYCRDVADDAVRTMLLALREAISLLARLELASVFYTDTKEELDTARQLIFFLRVFAGLECTIPHDMYYGFLGLLGSDKLPDALVPDYRLSFEQVSLRYCGYLISTTGDLRIIETYGTSFNDCPSWVPDLRYRHEAQDFPDRQPRASGTVCISHDGLKLSVEATKIGKLLHCSCQECVDGDVLGSLVYIDSTLVARAARITATTHQAIFVKWLNAFCDLHSESVKAYLSTCTCVDDLLAVMAVLRHYIADDMEHFASLRAHEKLVALLNRSCPQPDVVMMVLRLAQRRYCVLETGDIFECCKKRDDVAHDAEDAVWALKGSFLPSLLRPVDDGWQYCGTVLMVSEGRAWVARIG
jgi:hypothetical protein